MKYLKNNALRNDIIMTPLYLAEYIVKHFKPSGEILEPCRGTGNFSNYMMADWCEITEGLDFFECSKHYDWIITNPPWSKFRKFLQHSMKIADNIVFLIPIIHFWTKARLRDIRENDFGFKEILFVDTPKDFPQMGFQLGAVYLKRAWKDGCNINLPNFHKER